MRTALCILMLSSMLFGGCRTAKKVAVTSFRVVDAPARYIRERIDDEGTTTTTTTTTTSDVTNPGYVPQTAPPPAGANLPPTSRTTTSRPVTSRPVAPQPSPAAPRRPAATPTPAAQFPVARPVPGRPGYVYSLDPNGGMIDVTGYKPGDKAKDPYTKQIFIVP